ncbi:hypothetical protein [Cupriavidus sp. PET2-C1]
MRFIDHLEAIQCRVRAARDSNNGSNNGSNGGSKSDSKMNEVKSKQRPIPQPPPAEAANGARWVKPFALLAATLAVLQFGLLVGRYNSGNAALPAHSRSTSPQIDSSSSDGGSNLHAQFHPEATEAQIRAWLLREGLQIVDGPDAANRYTLHAGDAQRTLPVAGPGNPLARRGP